MIVDNQWNNRHLVVTSINHSMSIYSTTVSLTETFSTYLYAAPEQAFTTRYTKSVHAFIHALRVILFELFFPQSRIELRDWINVMKTDALGNVMQMIIDMVSDEPHRRPSVQFIS